MKPMKLSKLLQNKKLFSRATEPNVHGVVTYTLRQNYLLWCDYGYFLNEFEVADENGIAYNVEAGDWQERFEFHPNDTITFDIFKRTAYKDLI